MNIVDVDVSGSRAGFVLYVFKAVYGAHFPHKLC